MKDYVDIGSSPSAEDCEQTGPNCDQVRSRAECNAFRNQIRRELGKEPAGAWLKIKRNHHEFGDYLGVVCEYEEDDETAMNYAFDCENTSEHWDAISLQELKENRRDTSR